MDKAKTIQKWLCKKLTVLTVYSIYSLDIIRRAQKQELKCWSDFIFEGRDKELDLCRLLNFSKVVNGTQTVGKESCRDVKTSPTYPTERHAEVTRLDVFQTLLYS